MSFIALLGVVPVTDINAATTWYTALLGRAPDATPMPSLADWHLSDSAWLQVFQDAGRAGSTMLNLAVSNMDDEVATLTERGLTPGPVEDLSRGLRICVLTDPDGNRIALVENPRTS